MTQKFPLLFAPFRLRKHGLRSRIIVTGHAGKRTKLGYRVLKPRSSHNTLLLLPSGISVSGIELWAHKLVDAA